MTAGGATRLLAALLAAGLLVGCGGGEVSEDELPALVLQPADLPGAFTRFDHGAIGAFDTASGPRERLDRFDRKGGWKARYRRPGSAGTRGPLVVGSIADLFASADGAEQDLEAYREELARAGTIIGAPRIGDGSVAATRLQDGSVRVVFFTLAWRNGAVSASVSVNGFEANLDLDAAVELARKQNDRIARAGSD